MGCSMPWVERAMEGFARCFEGLKDPRTGNAGRHDLLEILMIALCTVLCGGQTAVDMAEFAEDKEAFLRGFLTLKHGLPSHDTFSRVFRLLDPEPFRACFQSFMARFAELTQGVIAIDGKAGPSIPPAARRRCTWSAPGDAISALSWHRSRPRPSPTKLLPSPNCWPCCPSRAPS